VNSYHGSCHCGAVNITLRSAKTASELGTRSCQCSFCRAHGASWTSDPDGRLEITVPREKLSRYRFGTGTAEFLICGTCGVVPAVIWEDGGRLLGVVRVNCLAESEILLANVRKADFDGETEAKRLERRARSWTPASLQVLG
jgi:hypothetical protein